MTQTVEAHTQQGEGRVGGREESSTEETEAWGGRGRKQRDPSVSVLPLERPSLLWPLLCSLTPLASSLSEALCKEEGTTIVKGVVTGGPVIGSMVSCMLYIQIQISVEWELPRNKNHGSFYHTEVIVGPNWPDLVPIRNMSLGLER